LIDCIFELTVEKYPNMEEETYAGEVSDADQDWDEESVEDLTWYPEHVSS